MSRAGKYRHRVNIEEPVLDRGSSGQVVADHPNKVIASKVPAEVNGVSGGERIRGLTIEEGVTSMVTMRYRTDVKANMRIIHDGRELNITSPPIDRDGKRRELVIMCQEKPK